MGSQSVLAKEKALFLALVALYSFLIIPAAPLCAQALKNTDLAPVIQHEPSTHAFRSGESVSIQATVKSKKPVKEVVLFWRAMGEDDYSTINMERQQQTPEIYSAIVPARLIWPWPTLRASQF